MLPEDISTEVAAAAHRTNIIWRVQSWEQRTIVSPTPKLDLVKGEISFGGTKNRDLSREDDCGLVAAAW